MLPVIMVFAKAPVPGRVKTRLTPPLAAESAAALHEAFVRDTCESLESLSGVEIELHTDAETDAWQDLQVSRRLQHEGDLGLKMFKALESALSKGHTQALIVGSDSPTLPPGHIVALLDSAADVSLGPTDDGGYYAIAARRTHPDMFSGARWSSPRAFEDTIRACTAAGLSTAIGYAWFDIDSFADLERLRAAVDIPRYTAAAIRSMTIAAPPRVSVPGSKRA